ncbi:MAG: NAD-dependent epimerase/dehydratase family protein [Thermoanaerobaculia bacterium]
MHLLVTGVAGFVGSRLARHLLERGDRVSGTWLDVRPDLQGVNLYEADVLDRAALERAVAESSPDAVVHLAGLSHSGEAWGRMADYFWVNVVGVENLLAAAGGRPVVIASSADVYGGVPPGEQPICEDRRIAPQTPYALTKAAAERFALAYGAVIVRSFNLIGPGQVPKFALASWASQIAAIRRGEKEPVLKVGDLSTRRDFVHVDDGAAAYRLLAEKGSPGTAYNLSSGKATEMREALDRILEISGVEVRVEENCFPPRPFDIPWLCGDPGRLRALGWEPRKTFDDAVRDLLQAVGL